MCFSLDFITTMDYSLTQTKNNKGVENALVPTCSFSIFFHKLCDIPKGANLKFIKTRDQQNRT